MKKIVVASAALVLAFGSFAQNDQIQNKAGVDIMPVSGEIGVGMNAIPFLTYVGDIFGLSSNNDVLDGDKFINYFGSQTLFGKYMLTDDNAVRVHLRYGQNNSSVTNYVLDDVAGHPDSLVSDIAKFRGTDFNVGVGYEFRRGKTRLRGIYGGELLYSYSQARTDYTYGNAFGTVNATPFSTQWTGITPFATNNLGERLQSVNFGNSHGLGLRLFGGVEYYIAPKICLGTEFGWSVGGSWSKGGVTTIETWDAGADAGTGAVVTSELNPGFDSRGLNIDTDNFNGALYLMFWF